VLKCVLSLNEQTIKLMVYVSSILTNLTNKNNMIIINKYTGRDVSREFLGLMEGIITNEEFELITMTLK